MTQLLHCWGYFKHFISLLSLWLQGEAAACQGQLQGRVPGTARSSPTPDQRQEQDVLPKSLQPEGAEAAGKAGVSQLCCFAIWA